MFFGLLHINGLFCMYLYPHAHSKPEIFPPLREIGFHLWLEQLVVFLWMCHNAFASSKVMDTLRFADVTNHKRQHAKDAQIAGRMIVSVLFTFFTFCARAHTIGPFLDIFLN
jgi:hypothetical protein